MTNNNKKTWDQLSDDEKGIVNFNNLNKHPKDNSKDHNNPPYIAIIDDNDVDITIRVNGHNITSWLMHNYDDISHIRDIIDDYLKLIKASKGDYIVGVWYHTCLPKGEHKRYFPSQLEFNKDFKPHQKSDLAYYKLGDVEYETDGKGLFTHKVKWYCKACDCELKYDEEA